MGSQWVCGKMRLLKAAFSESEENANVGNKVGNAMKFSISHRSRRAKGLKTFYPSTFIFSPFLTCSVHRRAKEAPTPKNFSPTTKALFDFHIFPFSHLFGASTRKRSTYSEKFLSYDKSSVRRSVGSPTNPTFESSAFGNASGSLSSSFARSDCFASPRPTMASVIPAV